MAGVTDETKMKSVNVTCSRENKKDFIIMKRWGGKASPPSVCFFESEKAENEEEAILFTFFRLFKLKRGDFMGRSREKVDVLVAKGKSHLTKAEIEARRDSEVVVPYTDISAPDYLTGKQLEKFNDLADKLSTIGILTELDVDCLASYVLAHGLYIAYTKEIDALIAEDDLKTLKEYQLLQDKAFKQCVACAKELGLTVTARAKIVLPASEEVGELWEL